MWNVLLTFESEGLLIASAAAEGDDNRLMSLGKLLRNQRRETTQPPRGGRANRATEKLAPVPPLLGGNLTQRSVQLAV